MSHSAIDAIDTHGHCVPQAFLDGVVRTKPFGVEAELTDGKYLLTFPGQKPLRPVAGVMLDTAGLTPSAQGSRVHWEGGSISVTDGPFTESKEVIGGYALMQCKDMAEALEWTKRFVKVHGEEWTVTCEVREIAEG